jgi:hypothetical protein
MKKKLAVFITFLLALNLVSEALAAESEPPMDSFLGSPLLALTAIIVVDVIAFLYRKLRR